MPILEVRALPQAEPKRIQYALKQTVVAIAEVYGCDPKHVWATWQEIEPGFYVEGESAAEKQPRSTHPPIAKLTCFGERSEDEIERLLLVASKTLSQNLGIEDNIFMTYHSAQPGQVVAGNGIVRG